MLWFWDEVASSLPKLFVTQKKSIGLPLQVGKHKENHPNPFQISKHAIIVAY